jgi:hypothetical protein
MRRELGRRVRKDCWQLYGHENPIAPGRILGTSTPRSNPEFTNPADNNWRVTTKEVRQLIDGLKEIIAHQISVTESTRTKLQEVIEDKQTLKSQNKELHEEARALRTQIEGLETTLPTKSCGLCL